MKVYVCVDAEGLSGIFFSEQVVRDGYRYDDCRRAFTRDVTALARGLKQAGVEEIYVRDLHGGARNAIWEQLPESVDHCIVGSSGRELLPGLDKCDAMILLGYHAMAGTPQAVLEHTVSSKEVQNCWLNGRPAGEIALHAGLAGDLGKPVILVTGDDKACAEAEACIPGVVTAQVKKGLHTFGASMLPPGKAAELLRIRAIEAVERFAAIKPFIVEPPVTIRVELTERTQLPSPRVNPFIRAVDGRTYEVSADTVTQAQRLSVQ